MPRQNNLARLRSVNPRTPPPDPQNSAGRWQWTGFRDKTLWDFLQLLFLPLLVAIGILYAVDQSNRRQERIAAAEQQRADERYQQELLQSYFNKMTTALTSNLRASPLNSESRTVAKASTLATLRELNGDRKGSLVQFLYDASLIAAPQPVISLGRANLEKVDLSGTTLNGIMLNGADLGDADLSLGYLNSANLDGAALENADLHGTLLRSAQLRGAFLRDANLDGADLQGANLNFAILSGASLQDAKLDNAILNGATLDNANLQGASLSSAALDDVLLCNTTLPDGKTSNRDCPSVTE